MERRRIGSLDVSVIGLGCNNFGTRLNEAASVRVVHAALDADINFLDTSDSYGDGLSEQYIGRALARRRGEMLIATKFGSRVGERPGGARPEYIRRAVDDSLRRLDVDHIDLYQLHKPDPDVPIADTLGALDELVGAGKVREIGCSNFTAAMIRDAEAAAARDGTKRFASLQNEYSLLDREPEREVLQECERYGIAFLPYYPLASGLLTGKYHLGEPPPEGSRLAASKGDRLADENLERVEALRDFAKSKGRTLLELAFAWLLARPTVASVIAGATKPEQVAANAATAAWTLGDEELAAVDSIVPPPL